MRTGFSRVRQLKLDAYVFLIFMNLFLTVAAFFKDVAFARLFGTSGTADAYTIGFFIPDMIGNNLLAAALGVACIPIFSRLLIKSKKAVYIKVVSRVSLILFISTLILTSALYIGSHAIISWYGGQLAEPVKRQTLGLFREMLPIVVIVPLTFVGVAILQTEKQFTRPAVAPVVYHLFLLISLIIMSVIGVSADQGGLVYGFLTSIAAFIYLILVWNGVLKNWRSDRRTEDKEIRLSQFSPYVRAIGIDLVPYLIILLFSQLLLLVERYYASGLESGTLAALNYAYRLVEFPISVFVAAVTTVLLPNFSRELSAKRYDAVLKQMRIALMVTIGLTICMSLGLFLLRTFIVTLLFKRGAFDEHSVMQTVTILTGYAFAIVGHSVCLVCLRYYMARRKMLVPLIIYFVGTSASILIDYVYIPRYGAIALGAAGSIGVTLSAVLFLLGFYRETKRIGGN